MQNGANVGARGTQQGLESGVSSASPLTRDSLNACQSGLVAQQAIALGL